MKNNNASLVRELIEGKTIKFRPHGNSMTPLVESGQLVTVASLNEEHAAGRVIPVGSVVYCKVNGRLMLHKVSAIGSDGRYQISNNHGHVNGWTQPQNLFGILIQVER